ncbi:MAG: glycine--tRNA ligase subunit beta [Myxococcales bacterium]
MDLILEIGCEELPASFQLDAVEYLIAGIKERFPEAQFPRERYATPRRLAVIATGLSEGSKDSTREVTGPPANAPEKAREGFARKSGVPVSALREQNGRLVATVVTRGVATAEVLPKLLESLIRSIPFRKSMRWDALETDPFARPVHWIVATLDGVLLPVSFADVESGTESRGHRFHHPGAVRFTARDYVEALREAHVLVDWEKRKARIKDEVARAAGEAGGVPRPDDDLYETVTGLVEEPSAVAGYFDEDFLELPPEVLVSEMRGHQKYFAVQDAQGKLLPAFVAVSNTRVKDPKVSRKGYERVLRARLSDGKFFFDEDLKTPLSGRNERLQRTVFVQGLGSQWDRVVRIRELALFLHGLTGKASAAAISQAAEVIKSDLASSMVGEFPELQGTIGRQYALRQGIPAEIADAIFEHYLPRGAEDELPRGDLGAHLGLADRLDQLVGLFALGKVPSGTSDPYGLRRAALGVLRITLGRGYRFDVMEALQHARSLHGKGDVGKVWEFLLGRLEVVFRDKGQPDSIQAVLHTGEHELVSLEKRLVALQTVREKSRGQFEAAAAAFKRIANILAQAKEKGLEPVGLKAELASTPAEKALIAALGRSEVAEALENENYLAAYEALAGLRPDVDQFFDDVMVMDPDPAQRDNRLALLRALNELFSPLADFSRLQVDKSS